MQESDQEAINVVSLVKTAEYIEVYLVSFGSEYRQTKL